ncbi:hypothetical protein LNP25_22015 [Klebsiella variicola subsp. variicola]|nr:hypothetical protein [Klebsiella variicola subsp. variicola]
MTAFPKVALIGPGAIGTTIAAALFEVGRAPMVCGRTAHSALVLRTDEGEIVVPGPVHTDPTAIAAPFNLVFVAVKPPRRRPSPLADGPVFRGHRGVRAAKRR